MKYLSLCSGIEAATVAWSPLGWEPYAFSEIEEFPCELLSYHYPEVPNLGDLTKHEERNLEEGIDLICEATELLCGDFTDEEADAMEKKLVRALPPTDPYLFRFRGVPETRRIL